MRPEANLKTYFVISICIHLIIYVMLNYIQHFAAHSQQNKIYEIISISEDFKVASVQKEKKSSKPVSLNPTIPNPQKSVHDEPKTPSESTEPAQIIEAAEPYYFENGLLTEGVRILNIDEVTRQVKRTPEAIINNIEGKIRLKLSIDKTGTLIKIVFVNRIGYGLDEVAEKAAQKLVIIPARTKTGPMASEIFYTVQFSVTHQ
ncbi:MAG: energy transducer TonB [Moraxellaceae bacterium]|nr:energy transducer TonB [Pseudobdellovibrionaceae bacterium]